MKTSRHRINMQTHASHPPFGIITSWSKPEGCGIHDPQSAPFLGGGGVLAPYNIHRRSMRTIPNGISIGSVVFAWLYPTDRQTKQCRLYRNSGRLALPAVLQCGLNWTDCVLWPKNKYEYCKTQKITPVWFMKRDDDSDDSMCHCTNPFLWFCTVISNRLIQFLFSLLNLQL